MDDSDNIAEQYLKQILFHVTLRKSHFIILEKLWQYNLQEGFTKTLL